MMTPQESALVLAKINAHHGNAQATKLQAECFHEELAGFVTLPLALEAVREFYAGNTTGRWMGSGDVNAYARRLRAERLPSDADIERLADERGLSDGGERWQFRRSLLKALGRGLPSDAALDVASRQAMSPMLSSGCSPALESRELNNGPSEGRTASSSFRVSKARESASMPPKNRLQRHVRNKPRKENTMTDITTQHIHDLFIKHGVGSEDDWKAWLDEHNFHPLADTPVPPAGFAYATIGDDGEAKPADIDLRDEIGSLRDGILCMLEAAEAIAEYHTLDTGADADIKHAERDLRCAADALERTLTYMGWNKPANGE